MADALSTLSMVEDYGLPLVLLLGSIYALYRFMVFALYEVKNEFGAHHRKAKDDMQEVKILLAEIKTQMALLLSMKEK
jgi:hypothetical protein|tara:strand:+ start:1763 stop:1996 length:234 start_codon:yes stop_codon:yes gene_type:complete